MLKLSRRRCKAGSECRLISLRSISPLYVADATGDAIEPESDSEIEEARPARVLKSKMLPTPAEVNEHNITHFAIQELVPMVCEGKG
jgi:hypothetical protein